jgi:hypothetical protein
VTSPWEVLAAQVIKAGVVDEWHLFIAPIVVGGGKQSLSRLKLELLDERRFGNGMVHSTTAPRRDETTTLPGLSRPPRRKAGRLGREEFAPFLAPLCSVRGRSKMSEADRESPILPLTCQDELKRLQWMTARIYLGIRRTVAQDSRVEGRAGRGAAQEKWGERVEAPDQRFCRIEALTRSFEVP